jgi:hypothetical protein
LAAAARANTINLSAIFDQIKQICSHCIESAIEGGKAGPIAIYEKIK